MDRPLSVYGHIQKLFFSDSNDFDSKTPSSDVEVKTKSAKMVFSWNLDPDSKNDVIIGIKSRPLSAYLFL